MQAEPCKITQIDYLIGTDEHQGTVAKLQLSLSDHEEQSISIDLPTPQTGLADFIVSKARWCASTDAFTVGSLIKVMSQCHPCPACRYTASHSSPLKGTAGSLSTVKHDASSMSFLNSITALGVNLSLVSIRDKQNPRIPVIHIFR